MITLENISKRIGGRTLFEDVTFTFNDGCRYGLTGPNGSGKSTLLKIIMGTESQTTGTVSLPKKVGFLKQRIEDNGSSDSSSMLPDIVINRYSKKCRLSSRYARCLHRRHKYAH